MRYYKLVENHIIVTVGKGCGGEEISESEYNTILGLIRNKPTAESGHDYRLRENLSWELYELPTDPEPEEPATEGYTESDLESMTNAQLATILAEYGISATMNKANMIRLILAMQR